MIAISAVQALNKVYKLACESYEKSAENGDVNSTKIIADFYYKGMFY